MTATDRAPTVNWWDSEVHVRNAEAALIRAGVLRGEDVGPGGYFRQRPEKWKHELESVELLEGAMVSMGIDPHEGWHMTWAEILKRKIEEEEAR